MVRRFAAQNRGTTLEPVDKESPAHVLVCYINPMPSRPRPSAASLCIYFPLLLAACFLFLLPFSLASQTPHRAAPLPRTVIIDTDAGSDDMMAIAFLLSRPDIRVEAITVVNGEAHVHSGGTNVLRLLELAGRR